MRLFFAVARSGERKNNFIMKRFTGLLLILLACSVLCSLLYPTMLDAQTLEENFQKFEQVELVDLLKDESLQTECNQFLTTKLKNFDWLRQFISRDSEMHMRCITLELRMERLLEKVAIVKKSEQGNIDAQLYLATEKIANMLALAGFRQTFDKFEQIDLWNVSVFTEFVEFYLKVKHKRDFIFYEIDSLYRLEQKEHDAYIDRINKIALRGVEWVEGLGFDALESEESDDFLEKYNEFSKSLKI